MNEVVGSAAEAVPDADVPRRWTGCERPVQALK
jgi:hypothetical protein